MKLVRIDLISLLFVTLISEVVSLSALSPVEVKKSFTAKVYIEDTDAYGVLYNANYLKYFDRAICSIFAKSNEQPVVSEIRKQRFRSSPSLGENVLIQAEKMTDKEISSYCSRWNLALTSEDGEAIFNSAILTVRSSDDLGTCDNFIQLNSIEYHSSDDSFQIYRDEIDFDGVRSFLPLRSVMNLFERSRSNFLGGPDALRKMQEVDGIVWVVTSVDETFLFSKACEISPGDDLVVRTAFSFRRSSVLECRQTLLFEDEHVAQATITIWSLDNITRRPKAAPEWVINKVK